jgi:hypothetical protein
MQRTMRHQPSIAVSLLGGGVRPNTILPVVVEVAEAVLTQMDSVVVVEALHLLLHHITPCHRRRASMGEAEVEVADAAPGEAEAEGAVEELHKSSSRNWVYLSASLGLPRYVSNSTCIFNFSRCDDVAYILIIVSI